MVKKITTITLLITSILLVSFYVISSTYSVIIEVLNNDGEDEIISKITIRDLVTDDNGMYNSNYYDAINELNITEEEANTIMDSVSLNTALDEVVRNIVSYHMHNGNKLSNNEIYNLIERATYNDDNISEKLREKILNKSREYLTDITDFLYNIETKYKDKL